MKNEESSAGANNPSGNQYASRDLSQNQSGIILDIPELQTSVCQCGHGRESHNRTVVIEDKEYQTACEFCPTCNKYLLKSMMEAARNYKHTPSTTTNKAKNDNDEEPKKESYAQKYSNGRLLEAVLIAGHHCFLASDDSGNIKVVEQVELEDKILKPLESGMYMNKPYSFESKEALDSHIEEVKYETIDSLYQKIVETWRKYVDADDFHIAICAADTLYTYFQDKIGSTHYLFFVGNNGSGKSNNLRVFQQLAYRCMASTDITHANIYRFLGTDEEGQGTICEDEADNIDDYHEKMRIYKNGYTTGFPVMRTDSSNYGTKQYAFNTFCFKAFAAERLPDSTKAKGFNQRCIEIPCYYGFPKYDITEVINPAGVEEYEELLNELNELRNNLLVYRLLHYHESIDQVKLNLEGRENQLFSPLVRVFNGTQTLEQLLPVISRYISHKRQSTADSWTAYLYRTIKEVIKQEDKTEIEFSRIWSAVTNGLSGSFKNEKEQTYESDEYGSISKKGVSETYQQIFGARQSLNRREARKLVFDKSKLERLGRQYDMEVEVEVVTGETDVTGIQGVGIERFTKDTDTPPLENPSQASQPSPQGGGE